MCHAAKKQIERIKVKYSKILLIVSFIAVDIRSTVMQDQFLHLSQGCQPPQAKIITRDLIPSFYENNKKTLSIKYCLLSYNLVTLGIIWVDEKHKFQINEFVRYLLVSKK